MVPGTLLQSRVSQVGSHIIRNKCQCRTLNHEWRWFFAVLYPPPHKLIDFSDDTKECTAPTAPTNGAVEQTPSGLSEPVSTTVDKMWYSKCTSSQHVPMTNIWGID